MAGDALFVENGLNLCIIVDLFRAGRKIPDQTTHYYHNKYDKKSFYVKHRLRQDL